MSTGTSLATAAGGAGALVATGGTVNAKGNPGGAGIRLQQSTGFSGNGGSSALGGGGVGLVAQGPGNAGGAYGAGGSGGWATGNGNSTAGGAGSAGVIIVTEYK